MAARIHETRSGTCALPGCGQSWQAPVWSNKKYCSRLCGYEAFKAREADKRRIAREQERDVQLRWRPGPWQPPASWEAGQVPPRPGRRMPTAARVAEFWSRRGAPFKVDLQTPACFACGLPVTEWAALERAHLVAHIYDGLDHEANLAMLCNGCHHHQPDGDPTGQTAILYIELGGWLGQAMLYMIVDGTLDEFHERAMRAMGR